MGIIRNKSDNWRERTRKKTESYKEITYRANLGGEEIGGRSELETLERFASIYSQPIDLPPFRRSPSKRKR